MGFPVGVLSYFINSMGLILLLNISSRARQKFMCLTNGGAKYTEMLEFGAEKGLLQGPCRENGGLVLKRLELP